MEENAYSIVDIDSSRLIRDQLELQFAKHTTENPDEDLTILVGGAGFTGIELLGELAERVPKLCKKYDIDRNKVRIINVEAMPNILPTFGDNLTAYAKKSLEDRGVEFRLDAAIKECTKDAFIIGEDNE